MKKLLGCLCVLLLHSFSTQATGRVFYISPSGSDANTATQAQNQSTPWKTLLPHTNSLASNDSVKYQCGGTYFDSADVRAAGAVLTSYGTGAQPVITGFYTVTSWTNLGGGIYESEAIPTNIGVNMVVINGKDYAMGRYPNAGTSNDGYLSFESHSGTASITDNQKPSVLDNTYAGAQLVMRVEHFQLARAIITGISGNTISFSGYVASGGGSLADNFGYFVQNDIKTLDQFGEWYYNPTTKKIDIYFGSSGPTGSTVQIAVRDKLLLPHAGNITISNLTLSGANYCIYSDWTENNVTIKNCNLLYSGYSNVAFAGMKNTNLLNDTLSYGHVNGAAWFSADSNILVRNCKISNIVMFPGMVIKDPNAHVTGNGIYTGGTDSVLIEKNTFKNMGYIGVNTNDGNYVTIQNNNCDSFAITLDDAGAYYMWSSRGSKVLHDRYILNNIATNGMGTGFGTPASDGVWGADIYCDDGTKNVIVSGNTGGHSTFNGLYMHNTQNITITNNTFFDNALAAIETQHDLSTISMTGNVLKNNYMVGKTAGQLLANVRSNWNDLNTIFSVIDSNYYGRLTNDAGAFITNWFSNSTQSWNFAGWKTYMSGEANSKRTIITDPAKIIFKYNTSQVVSKRLSFCTPLVGVDNVGYSKLATVNPDQSIILLAP